MSWCLAPMQQVSGSVNNLRSHLLVMVVSLDIWRNRSLMMLTLSVLIIIVITIIIICCSDSSSTSRLCGNASCNMLPQKGIISNLVCRLRLDPKWVYYHNPRSRTSPDWSTGWTSQIYDQLITEDGSTPGLYLPTSDLDLVVVSSGCDDVLQGLKAMANSLLRRGMAKNIQVLKFGVCR